MKSKVVEIADFRKKQSQIMKCNQIIPGMDPDRIETYEFQPCSMCQIKCKDLGQACLALDMLASLASEADLDTLLQHIGTLRRMFTYVEYQVPGKE